MPIVGTVEIQLHPPGTFIAWYRPAMTRANGQNPNLRPDSAARDVSYAIGVGRIVWGAIAAVVPGRVHRALGVSYPGEDYGVWVKAFGVRDILLGIAALHPNATIRDANLRAGIVMDVVDVVMVADAHRRGLPRKAAVLGMTLGGGTAAFATLGPMLLRQLK